MLDVNALIALGQDPATLLEEVHDGTQVLQVREHGGLRWVYGGGAFLLSAFRPAAPDELVFPNHRSMLCALLCRDAPGTVLNLGFGLGSFERYLMQRLPSAEVVSVDSSAALVDLSRRWFAIPSTWPVVVEEAARYLAHAPQRFELVLCDIFEGGVHAPCLHEPAFYAAVADRLADGGVLSLNLSPESEADAVRILLALRGALPHVAITPVSDHGNVVVLASARPLPGEDALARRARERREELGMDIAAEAAAFTLLPR